MPKKLTPAELAIAERGCCPAGHCRCLNQECNVIRALLGHIAAVAAELGAEHNGGYEDSVENDYW